MKRHSLALALTILAAASPAASAVKVVTTIPAYASLSASIGGDRVAVQSIARSEEDAHFVTPKPSFAVLLRDADLFVTTGLDLELWAPVLVDKSGNRSIRPGENGYVNASQGVVLLDIPGSADRSAGDVHLYGNPHITTSPLNIRPIAANIAAGLTRVDPAGASTYESNLARLNERLDAALYGSELPGLLGRETLDSLCRQGTLISFLESQELSGRKLVDRLGGWLGAGLPFRGRKIVAYHKNWIYLTSLLGLEVVDYIEPKPGIPPSPRHVKELIEAVKSQRVQVLLAASYFDPRQIDSIAQRTGARAVVVPLGPADTGPEGYFSLVDSWVNGLATAFAAGD